MEGMNDITVCGSDKEIIALLKDANKKLGKHARELQKDAGRYRFLKRCESLQVDERDVDGKWEPIGDLDKAIDEWMDSEK